MMLDVLRPTVVVLGATLQEAGPSPTPTTRAVLSHPERLRDVLEPGRFDSGERSEAESSIVAGPVAAPGRAYDGGRR